MNKNTMLVGSLVLIILAIGMVALLDRSSSQSEGSTDVRARAAITNTLMINAVVESTDETLGTITVQNVYFADSSRAGEARDMGTWIVTPPSAFNLGSVSPGTRVRIGVDSKTFLAAKRTLTAVSIVPTQ
jgi:hypothetical protein